MGVQSVFERTHGSEGHRVVFKGHVSGLGNADAMLTGQGAAQFAGQLMKLGQESFRPRMLCGIGGIHQDVRMKVAVTRVPEIEKGQTVTFGSGPCIVSGSRRCG